MEVRNVYLFGFGRRMRPAGACHDKKGAPGNQSSGPNVLANHAALRLYLRKRRSLACLLSPYDDMRLPGALGTMTPWVVPQRVWSCQDRPAGSCDDLLLRESAPPTARRLAVGRIEDGLGRACAALGTAPSTVRDESRRATIRLVNRSAQWRRRWGYRRLAIVLRRDGWAVTDQRSIGRSRRKFITVVCLRSREKRGRSRAMRRPPAAKVLGSQIPGTG